MSTVNILGMNKKATPLESDELCAKSAADLVSLIKKREIIKFSKKHFFILE